MPSAAVIHVVDDELGVRRSLERLLRAHGFHAHTYGSAEEFLEVAEAFGSGCILLDNQMSGLSGLELQRILAAGGSNWQIVFLTGQPDAAAAVAMEAGAVDVLLKPAPGATIIDALRRALARCEAATQEKKRRSGD
jgi:two-component system, LuxR family, response regulator FixJ